MSSPHDLFLKNIYHKFDYHATWLPNVVLTLGDVGIFEGLNFRRVSSLKAQKINFTIRKGKKPINFFHTSSSSVSIDTKVAAQIAPGTALPLMRAGVTINFTEEGAFYFSAVDCLVDEIEDRDGLGRAIVGRLEKKKWDYNWVVVDSIVQAGSTTILVSSSRNAKIELCGNAPLVSEADLAKVDANFSISSRSGSITDFIAEKGLYPLFKISRLKKSLISTLMGDKQIRFGGSTAQEPLDKVLEAVGVD